MKLLLDSNIVLPLVRRERQRLGAQVDHLLSTGADDTFVSIASLWEIAIKARLGKLPLGFPVAQLSVTLAAFGYSLLAIDQRHAVEDLLDQPATNDPFDRMLLAQCQVEGMRLVTADRVLKNHPLVWRP